MNGWGVEIHTERIFDELLMNWNWDDNEEVGRVENIEHSLLKMNKHWYANVNECYEVIVLIVRKEINIKNKFEPLEKDYS